MTTGLAGCGRMGFPMGLQLHFAGIPVRGFDIRSNDAFAPLPMCFDPGAFGRDLSTLFTVVRDETQTNALLFDEQALLAQAPDLETLVICSTLRAGYIAELRARVPAHIRMIDAPMSGASVAAEAGQLTFMLGGETGDISDMMLHFGAMGGAVHHVGPLGSGMLAKVLNNLVAAASTAATRTALAEGETRGLDHKTLLAILHASSGQTWFGSGFDEIEFAREGFAEDNSIGLLAKDLECVGELAATEEVTALIEALGQVVRSLKPIKT